MDFRANTPSAKGFSGDNFSTAKHHMNSVLLRVLQDRSRQRCKVSRWTEMLGFRITINNMSGIGGIPYTGNTSSPDVTRGNALILVYASRCELGASYPKFSELQAVTAFRLENWYFHTIILIYKLRKPSIRAPHPCGVSHFFSFLKKRTPPGCWTPRSPGQHARQIKSHQNRVKSQFYISTTTTYNISKF